MKSLKAVCAAVAAGAVLLAGCGSSSSSSSASGTSSTGTKKSIVEVINGPLGDQSFFDDAERGMKELASEGHKTQTIQSDANNPAQWKSNLESVSTGKWDLVVTGTSQMVEILQATATKYPKQKYVIYDSEVKASNVASITYKQNEGAYLAGVLAALATTNKDKFPKATGSKVVGLVGGMDVPIINDFIVGFKKGVETVDSSIQVKTSFVGNFTDSNKGYDQAKVMYDQGADVVFQVAGGAGAGVLKAAKEADRYAIGVDSNQNAVQQGNVLASMLKNIGISLESAGNAFDQGTLKFGETTTYGLANKGVSLDYDNNGGIVPQDIQDKVQSYAQQVIDGKVTVPTTL